MRGELFVGVAYVAANTRVSSLSPSVRRSCRRRPLGVRRRRVCPNSGGAVSPPPSAGGRAGWCWGRPPLIWRLAAKSVGGGAQVCSCGGSRGSSLCLWSCGDGGVPQFFWMAARQRLEGGRAAAVVGNGPRPPRRCVLCLLRPCVRQSCGQGLWRWSASGCRSGGSGSRWICCRAAGCVGGSGMAGGASCVGVGSLVLS